MRVRGWELGVKINLNLMYDWIDVNMFPLILNKETMWGIIIGN